MKISLPGTFSATKACRMVKTLILVIAGVITLAPGTFARDSTWLLADNGKLAVTTFEHRAGEGRATTVTVIYGEHILRGVLNDADSGRIKLKKETPQEPENDYRFTGNISINYEKSQITLKGKLTVGGSEIGTYSMTVKARELGED